MKGTEQFILGDLVFDQTFLTATSTSFAIRQVGDGLSRGAERGWVDIHWPCEGNSAAAVRGSLPESYLTLEHLRTLVDDLINRRGIPEEACREVLFFNVERSISFSDSGSLNDETTDRIETTRSFRLP